MTYNTSMAFNLERAGREDLIAAEWALEEEAMTVAIARVTTNIKREGLDATKVGKRQTDAFLGDVSLAIEEWLETTKNSGGKNRPVAYKYLVLALPKVLAYIVSRVVIHSFTKRSTFVNTSVAIGRTLKDMVEYEILKVTHKDVAKAAEQRLKYAGSDFMRESILRQAYTEASHRAFERLSWIDADLLQIGGTLLSIFESSTGFIKTENEYIRKITTKFVVPTDLALEWLDKSTISEALLSPFHYPMLIVPKPWTTPYDGGYLNKQMHNLKLVMSPRKVVNRRLEAEAMPEVYSAINALQATPWKINKPVYDVFKILQQSNENIAQLPSTVLKDSPVKPWDDSMSPEAFEEWKLENDAEFVTWKRRAGEIHADNNKRKAKRRNNDTKVTMGQRFYDMEAFYFVYGMDFRQRFYPASGSSTINPQSDDSGKALIHFACGAPMGEYSGFWLGFHVANCWGNDKDNLDDRAQWAVDNTFDILSYAADPLVNTGWMEADKPFGFLAACFEWAGFMEKGSDHITHLPISADGACNGLQHFGAILKDRDTCEAVNVIPRANANKPADVYMEVHDKVAKRLESVDIPIAVEARTRIDRNLVKHPTMTSVYAVTLRGMQKQVTTAILKAQDSGKVQPFSVSASEAADYLTPLVDSAIREVVSGATLAMDWLKHLAEVCTKDGKPVVCVSPSGFTMTQDYKKHSTKRCNILYKGANVRIKLHNETTELDVKQAVSAISANFVHLHDASHLTKTVNLCVENNVDSFAMIHDSYGVLAPCMPILYTAVRLTFLDQYKGNVLKELWEQTLETLSDEARLKLDPPPPQGILDLSAVLDSEYFFA